MTRHLSEVQLSTKDLACLYYISIFITNSLMVQNKIHFGEEDRAACSTINRQLFTGSGDKTALPLFLT